MHFSCDAYTTGRPVLRLLSPHQQRQIHLASLEILERTGVRVMHPAAVDLLTRAGAWVEGGDRVRIPGHLVEAAIAAAPGRIAIYDRNGEPAMHLEGDNSYFGTGPTIQFVYDPHSGQRRETDYDDIAAAARLCDHLPNIDFVMTMGMTGGVNPAAKGLNPATTDRRDFVAMLANTVKPLIFSTWSRDGLADIYDMAVALRGSEAAFQQRPFMIAFAEPTSPLLHSHEALDQLLYSAEKRIPLIYIGAVLMGATGPVSAAGSLALANAECLSGLTIHQLARRGAPFIYGGCGTPLDMRTSGSPYNGPEAYQGYIAARDMARAYGLPDFNLGGATDAKSLDPQASLEAGLSLLQAALAGSNLIHDVGYMESGMTASWELIVLCDEIIDGVRAFLKGMPVDAESLATEVIHRVGPGGEYLSDEHTLTHFKKIWYPRLIDRSDHDTWRRNGAKPLDRVLTERVNWILQHHVPEPLADDVQARIDAILQRLE